MRLAIVAAAFAIVALSFALQTTPIFNGWQGSCFQYNTTYLSCEDGTPVTIAFAASAPYGPMFGNFTITALNIMGYSEPYNIYRYPCQVGSSSTASCFITLYPTPLFSGNGTNNVSIKLKLESNIYPGVIYYRSMNITIHHYLGNQSSYAMKYYNSTMQRYEQIRNAYVYLCSTYDLCNVSIAQGIDTAQRFIANATSNMANFSTAPALYNISKANATLSGISYFGTFINRSNDIINGLNRIKNLDNSANSIYYGNASALETCKYPNGTTYAELIKNEINVTTNNSVDTVAGINSTILYLESIIKNENASIKACTSGQTKHSTGIISSLQAYTRSSEFKYTIIGITIAGLAAIFIAFKANEMKEIRKIREELGER